MQKITINKEKCMNCLGCILGCMSKCSEQSNSIYDLNLLDETIESSNFIAFDKKGRPTPVICKHCDEPECVNTCMSGALTKNEKTGLVKYDKNKCATCYMCILACENGILKIGKTKEQKIAKCDGCYNREIPECVKVCPTGALEITKENTL